MRPSALGIVAACATAFTLVAGGCSLLTKYDDFTGDSVDASLVDAAPKDAGREAAYEASTEDTLCSPSIPLVPNVSSIPVMGIAQRTFAGVVSNLRLTQAAGGCVLGKNLDGLDTSCVDGGDPPACAPVDPLGRNCDQSGGIDNAAQSPLFDSSNIGNSKVNILAEWPADVAAQRSGFVLSISSYAGELNNPEVNVDYYPDVGVADGGGTLIDNAAISAGRGVFENTAAYVNNGVLVAKFARLPLHYAFFFTDTPDTQLSAVIWISDAWIIGHPVLDVDAGGLRMDDAQLVGRIVSDDFVAFLANLDTCVTYSDMSQVCGLLDLTDGPSNDGKGPGCDAISFAVGFDLSPTTIAGTAEAVPAVNLCIPDGSTTYEGFVGNLCGTTLDAGASGN